MLHYIRHFQKSAILAFLENLMDTSERKAFLKHLTYNRLLRMAVKWHQQRILSDRKKHPQLAQAMLDFDQWYSLQELFQKAKQESIR